MGRIAAILILLSQILLVWVALDPTGISAMWFSFVGHPLVGAGVLLALWTIARRQARERSESTSI